MYPLCRFPGRLAGQTFGILAFLFSFIVAIAGCGGGSKPIAVTISPSTSQSIDYGQSITLSASTANDVKNAGVSWTHSGVGALANQTTTGATYVAPTAAPGGSAAITAASVSSPTVSASVSVTVTAPPSFTTTSLPAGTEGTAYSQTVSASGGAGTLAYSVSSGSLPAGLSLSSSTGAITGTPTGPNTTSNFTVKVTDSSTAGAQSATQALSIAINQAAPPAITTTSLPGAVEFTAYSQTIAATGYAPLTYSVSAGSLPAGLSLNSSTGTITGTPAGPNATSNFTVQVTDHSNPVQTATQALSIAVSLPAAPTITTTTLPNAVVATPYSQTLAVSSGHGPFTWSISAGSLPSGLSINASTGVISGTPGNTTGTFNFTAKVVDSSNPPQSATQALTITVTLGPLAITPAALPTGALTETYPSASLNATGGLPPYTWSITSATGTFPPGLTLNSSSGAISGTPTTAGTYNFTAQVKDSTNATITGNFTIQVNAALAITTSSPLPAGTQGTSYSDTFAATGGVPNYTWSVVSPGTGSLPAGLSLSTSGQLSGIPTASGTFTFTVQVTDSFGYSTTANLSLTLAAAPTLSVTTSGSLPSGTVNTAYPASQLNATGGIQPYSWVVVTPGTGPLPPGLTLSSGGQITGTPTATGTYPFTVQVTDSATPTPNTATANLSITVNAAAITCDTTLTGKESLLLGDYAFVTNGFDSAGNPAAVGGVFVASGAAGANNITAGTLDLNLDATNGVTSNSLTSGSKYNLGQDSTGGYRGCMTFVTSAGTQHFAFSVDSVGSVTANVASDGHMINFDATGPFTAGILRQATSSAFSTNSITGSWAFGVDGAENSTSGGGKLAVAGVLNFSSGSVSGSGDVNNNGSVDDTLTAFPATAGITFNNGTYSVASNGRGTLAFTPSDSTSQVTMFVYVVSSNEVLFMDSDIQSSTNGGSPFTGRALKQSGTFSNSSLSGNHVIYASGISGTPGATRTEFDLVSTSGTTFSFAGYQNDGGSVSDPTSNSGSGSFNVASNGRVTLSCSACGKHLPIFYLSSANTGFFINSDNSVSFGYIVPQSSGTFSNSSLSGLYGFGTFDPQASGVSNESGAATFTPTTTPPSITGTSDKNAQGSLNPDGSISGTYSVSSNGVAVLPSGCTLTGTNANCDNLFVILSPTQAVMMKVISTNTTPAVSVLEH